MPFKLSSSSQVDDAVPLFLSLPDDNGDGVADEKCFAARMEYPFAAAEGTPLQLDYTMCSADDVRQVDCQENYYWGIDKGIFLFRMCRFFYTSNSIESLCLVYLYQSYLKSRKIKVFGKEILF